MEIFKDWQAKSQAGQLRQFFSTMLQLKRSVENWRVELESNYQAAEMNIVRNYIGSIMTEIDILIVNLNRLSEDIVTAAADIRREEEAAAARKE